MIELSWVNSDQKTIRANFVGRWTWDEYYASITEMRAMAMEMDHPIDVIFDLNQSALLSLSSPVHGDHTLRILSERIGVIVIVANNVYVKILFTTFQQVYRKWSAKVLMVETLDEAYILIQQRSA